ncbi:MAG: ABC transporter ATP-binding protein [Balneolales bacterium]
MNEEPVIQIEDLMRIYEMGDTLVHALNGVTFNIQKNEYIAIMGPSGSGKSTLMNVIGCLDTPTSGKYVLNGNNVSKMNDNELAWIRNKEIGFIFQTFNLLPKSNCLSNVELPLIYSRTKLTERRERATAVLTKVGLGNRIDHIPSQLSGGQSQRVAVARALVNNPSILLADEPTGSLDTKTGHEIMVLFEELYRSGNTIILVTHEEEIARHARRIIRLRDGQIESDDPVPEPFLAKEALAS